MSLFPTILYELEGFVGCVLTIQSVLQLSWRAAFFFSFFTCSLFQLVSILVMFHI